MKQVDYIIVGQGLAGTTLAQYLHKNNRSFIVIGGPGYKRASEVAAGLFNPVTGKKMVLTWNAEILFPLLHRFYAEAEAWLGRKLLYSKTIYRPFSSIQDQNDFWARSTEKMNLFISTDIDHALYAPYVHNECGGIATRQSGYVLVEEYLNAAKEVLTNRQQYIEEDFRYEMLQVQQDGVLYKDMQAKKIIFAQGYHNASNPYFSWVPVQGMKGEILTAQIDEYPVEDIVNKYSFIIPLGNKTYRIGSTYERSFDHDEPTAEGLEELKTAYQKVIRAEGSVLDQRAGIRPVISDHRPVTGPHPEYPAVVILNGLGTKGVSLAPYASLALTNFLVNNQEIEESISVNRFKSLYFKKKETH